MLSTIDHVILPVSSVADAAAPFERLGFTLTPPARHAGQGSENRVFFIGDRGQEFYVELLAVHNSTAARAAGRQDLVDAAARPAAVARVMFATSYLNALKARLESAGVEAAVRHVAREDGSPIGDVLTPGPNPAGCEFAIIQYAEELTARATRHDEAGLFRHQLQPKRLDHLAAIVHDLEPATRFWTDVLGVPVFGEVPMGTAGVIRQMKVDDAILELIGPTGEGSALRERPPGLISMCAFEMADLAAAVAIVRDRGFTCPDPAPGPLPGTRVASVPAAEVSGLTLQMLEYV